MKALGQIACVFFVLVTGADAQRNDWAQAHANEISRPLSKLPPEVQRSVASPLQMKVRDLNVEIHRDHGLIFAQAEALPWCGATGNCAFWVLDSHYKLLLQTRAQMVAIVSGTHRGHKDILTRTHDSAFDGFETLWQFDGAKYRPSECARITFLSPDAKEYAMPHVEKRPCAEDVSLKSHAKRTSDKD